MPLLTAQAELRRPRRLARVAGHRPWPVIGFLLALKADPVAFFLSAQDEGMAAQEEVSFLEQCRKTGRMSPVA